MKRKEICSFGISESFLIENRKRAGKKEEEREGLSKKGKCDMIFLKEANRQVTAFV